MAINQRWIPPVGDTLLERYRLDECIGNGPTGSVFQATLNDVVLREVSIDPETYISSPVAGGDTWCLDDYTIEALTLQWD